MKHDLFNRLFTYKPSDKVFPLENFTTEILAYILRSSKTFLEEFLKLIGKTEHIETDWTIETQVFIPPYGIFDIIMRSKDDVIIIENKIDSGFGVNQLGRYKMYIDDNLCSKGSVVTLTKSLEFTEELQKAGKNLTWLQLYSHMFSEDDKKLEFEPNMENILINFKFFLKEHGMGLEKITFNLANGTTDIMNFISLLNHVCSRLANELDLKVEPSNSHFKGSGMGFFSQVDFKFAKNAGEKFIRYYYVLNDVKIYAMVPNKYKDLFNSEQVNAMGWDTQNICFDTFDIVRQHFLGLELNEQEEILRKWIEQSLKHAFSLLNKQ